MAVTRALCAAVVALALGDAAAVTLYKHVDPSGRVTYSDQPPAAPAKRLERFDVDPGPPGTPPAAPRYVPSETAQQLSRQFAESRARERAAEAVVTAAERELDAAKHRLFAAQESNDPEDFWWVGAAMGRNPTRLPRPEYLARVEALEGDLRAAEEKLAEARRRAR